jgi:hypothetical protein
MAAMISEEEWIEPACPWPTTPRGPAQLWELLYAFDIGDGPYTGLGPLFSPKPLTPKAPPFDEECGDDISFIGRPS